MSFYHSDSQGICFRDKLSSWFYRWGNWGTWRLSCIYNHNASSRASPLFWIIIEACLCTEWPQEVEQGAGVLTFHHEQVGFLTLCVVVMRSSLCGCVGLRLGAPAQGALELRFLLRPWLTNCPSALSQWSDVFLLYQPNSGSLIYQLSSQVNISESSQFLPRPLAGPPAFSWVDHGENS